MTTTVSSSPTWNTFGASRKKPGLPAKEIPDTDEDDVSLFRDGGGEGRWKSQYFCTMAFRFGFQQAVACSLAFPVARKIACARGCVQSQNESLGGGRGRGIADGLLALSFWKSVGSFQRRAATAKARKKSLTYLFAINTQSVPSLDIGCGTHFITCLLVCLSLCKIGRLTELTRCNERKWSDQGKRTFNEN